MSKTVLSNEQNNNSTLFTQILKVYQEVYSSQNKGASAPQIKNETVLLDSGLDSLGHAILITRLEEKLGYDPFSISTEAYYPRTFGELVEFYRANIPI